MRIARCKAPLSIHAAGNRKSVLIGEGWQGDLDEVIGVQTIPEKVNQDDPSKREPERHVDVTVADMLGHHLNEANFEALNDDGTPIVASPASTPRTKRTSRGRAADQE